MLTRRPGPAAQRLPQPNEARDRAGPSPRDTTPHGADPVLCEAALTANPVAFSLGCAVNKDGSLV
jgi:hypothetical protein